MLKNRARPGSCQAKLEIKAVLRRKAPQGSAFGHFRMKCGAIWSFRERNSIAEETLALSKPPRCNLGCSSISQDSAFAFSMRNLKLVLAYDGTDFCGWQVQPDAPSIQGTLGSAIGRITGENVLPQGSGRTDAGVHALEQVATFPTDSVIPA